MTRRRAAFSLVELLVAIVLLGIGAAGLAGALAGERRLRTLAELHVGAARFLRERGEALQAIRCSADTGGVRADRWGVERWRAVPSGGAWWLLDSLVPPPPRKPIVVEARIACPD